MKSPPRYPRRSGHRPDYDVRAVFKAIAKNEATDEEDVKETRPRRRRMRHPRHGKIVESDDELRTSLRDSTTEQEGPEEENDVEDGGDLVSIDWSGIWQGALDECEEALGKEPQPSASNNVLPEGEVKLDETKAAEIIESDSDEDDHHFEVRTRRDLPREDFRDLCREITHDIARSESEMQFDSRAIDLLQEATEDCLVSVFKAAGRLAARDGRDTVTTADIRTVVEVARWST